MRPPVNPIIMKFGGTSVGDVDAISRACEIVRRNKNLRPVVVVSAMREVTDALVASVEMAQTGNHKLATASLQPYFERHGRVARELLPEADARRFTTSLESARVRIADLLRTLSARTNAFARLEDEILSYGEVLSSKLFAEALLAAGLDTVHIDARRCIRTDAEHGKAEVLPRETESSTRAEFERHIRNHVAERSAIGNRQSPIPIPVLGGFIASSLDGATTTLGRGGSDYSAAIIGSVIGAREIQIWTDVCGVLTADPRVVRGARTIPRLSYDEAAELAYFGAKVLHPKTIQPAIERSIPVRICNSMMPDELGTLVCAESETAPRTVKAIAHKTGITTIQITSARMLGSYGFLRAIFEIFDRHRTSVDVVTTSEVSVSISIDCDSTLPQIVEELRALGAVRVEHNRAIVCVVGEGLRETPGIAARVFRTISDINVSLISQGASRINLTFAVDAERAADVVSRLHEAFFEQDFHRVPNIHETTESLVA